MSLLHATYIYYTSFTVRREAIPITAKYLSERIGMTEVLETSQGLSMGVADNRDGASLMQRLKEKDLVMPSEIQNLRDMGAYLKIQFF